MQGCEKGSFHPPCWGSLEIRKAEGLLFFAWHSFQKPPVGRLFLAALPFWHLRLLFEFPSSVAQLLLALLLYPWKQGLV